MFYPHQMVLIPNEFIKNNPSRFIKLDGSSVDRNIIPEEILKLSLFEKVLCDTDSCLPYYNENDEVYEISGVNMDESLPEVFSNSDNASFTVIPGECGISLTLNDKNKKLICTGVDIYLNENTYLKHQIYPKEVQIFGYNNGEWTPITGIISVRTIDENEKDKPEFISLDWSYKENQIVPYNGFKLKITKWSKLIVNINPGIKNVRFKFKEDQTKIKTVNVESPDGLTYCFDLFSYLKTNINNNDLALENKIVNLIKKHIKLPEPQSDEENNNYIADLSMFYNKNIVELEKRLEDVEDRETYGEVKIISASNDDSNTLKCDDALFQEVITTGENLKEKDIIVILPDNPRDGDGIKITSLRRDTGKTMVQTGKYKATIAIDGKMGTGTNITLHKYGSTIRLTFFKENWLGIID